jgi:hypothetical protein
MKRLFLILTLALTGCVSHFDRAGNYNNYSLTPSQATQVARSVTAELKARYPARTVFSFPHDSHSVFSAAMENSLRDAGMGVSIEDVAGYHRLTYKLDRFNNHQFFIAVTVNQSSFQMIWSDDDNALARLKTVTQFEVTHE